MTITPEELDQKIEWIMEDMAYVAPEIYDDRIKTHFIQIFNLGVSQGRDSMKDEMTMNGKKRTSGGQDG